MKTYHYLPIRAKELLWRCGALYVPLVILLAMSGKSITKFTIWFIIIAGLLFLEEYFGVYFTIKDNILIQRTFLGLKKNILIENIKQIKKGRFGLSHTESMECYYEKDGSKKEFTVTLFSREPKEIKKFIDDIKVKNSNISIDPELEKWYTQKLNAKRV